MKAEMKAETSATNWETSAIKSKSEVNTKLDAIMIMKKFNIYTSRSIKNSKCWSSYYFYFYYIMY